MAQKRLDSLKLKRDQCIAACGRISSFVAKLQHTSITKKHIFELKSRLDKLPSISDRFETVQSEVESLSDIDDEIRLKFENDYFTLCSQIQEIIEEFNQTNPCTSSSSYERSQKIVPSQIQLPLMNLPTFSGEYHEWLEFKDSFLSLVDSNSTLTNIQKFFHLRSCLKGEVLETIKSITVSNEGYPQAWQQLVSRYEKTHLIANNHIKEILQLPVTIKDSSKALRSLHNSIKNNLEALKNLQVPVQHWDLLLISIISEKLDTITLREWERFHVEKKEVTLQNLLTIISNRADFLETIENKPRNYIVQSQKSNKNSLKTNCSKTYTMSHTQSIEPKCKLCHESYHPPFKCDFFLKATTKDRYEKVKQAGWCINCLKSTHSTKQCKSSRCKKCGKPHNTLLHFESNTSNSLQSESEGKPKTEPKPDLNISAESASIAMTQIHCEGELNNLDQILLPTAIIELIDKNNQGHRCRVLLDSGAMSNFISTELCNKLGLVKKEVNCSIKGVGQSIQQTHFMVKIQFKLPQEPNTTMEASCLVIDKITSDLPMFSFDLNTLKLPYHITLADPNFNKSQKIDILIGSSLFWSLLANGRINIPGTGLTLQETRLGWIVGGHLTTPRKQGSINKFSVNCCVTNVELLNNKINQFWELEEVENKHLMSPDDQYCEELFKNSHRRGPDGHFIVKIPFKPNVNQLGDSRLAAINRFKSLERQFSKNKQLHLEYSKTINEYITMGHMKEVRENPSSELVTYYIPHLAVIREDRLTSKTRVVFDASMNSSSGLSLNDVQYVGPKIQNDLFSILINFRMHQYVISGDISKMYRMIWLHDGHTQFHRVFWREHCTEPLTCYELQTVTFGTASAPYLAMRCIQQLAIEHEKLYPKACKIIKNNFYVDDLVFGTETISELVQLQNEICTILTTAGFHLRKWLCNNHEVYNKLKLNSDLECSTLEFGGKTNKTLGIMWNSQQDQILYSDLKLTQNSIITKRKVLSELSRLFDPLGLLGPIITTGKLLMQQLWKISISWDEPLPADYINQWTLFRTEINRIPLITINRKVLINNFKSAELHGFCDASEKAYGAAIYMRSTDNLGRIQTSILCSKSRLAPLKTISIPKLELCGALLLSKLMNKVQNIIDIKVDKKHYWCDSTIVLAWIRSEPSRWKTFVANRVGEIQDLTNVNDWHHTSTSDNPADLISRGASVSKLKNSHIWWFGPTWLSTNYLTIKKEIYSTDMVNLPEEKSRTFVTNTVLINEPFDLITKYSSFKKLLRVTSYCLRFIKNCLIHSEKRSYEELSAEEVNSSLNCLIRLMQRESFPEDYNNLSKNKSLSCKSHLLSLNPFLDYNQIMRVGGRLDNSNLSFESKHQIILSPKHHISKLLIQQIHSDNLHCGPTTLLAVIRQKYWPVHGRRVVRGVTRKCRICFLAKPRACKYLMGQLPKVRIEQVFPFQNVGVDYAGPILIKDRKTKNYKTLKSYICLFVCMASKAIHLECVTELTTEGFLSCLRRFVSRRGKPSNIYSDNGKNFVGANREIKHFYNFIQQQSNPIQKFLTHEQISWHFIPARSPTFGGLWEASIKNVKTYLYKTMKTSKLHYEDLNTILCQIEAIVNSRPLTPLTSDPSDLTPLTPGHFLIGRSLTHHPELNSQPYLPASRLKHFQMLTQITNHFWRRWSAEYISQLQVRTKWKHAYPNDQAALQIGKMVLVKEDNTAPMQWPLGRITELHPGPDGIIRAVSINLRGSTVKRGITKVCVLPEDDP